MTIIHNIQYTIYKRITYKHHYHYQGNVNARSLESWDQGTLWWLLIKQLSVSEYCIKKKRCVEEWLIGSQYDHLHNMNICKYIILQLNLLKPWTEWFMRTIMIVIIYSPTSLSLWLSSIKGNMMYRQRLMSTAYRTKEYHINRVQRGRKVKDTEIFSMNFQRNTSGKLPL